MGSVDMTCKAKIAATLGPASGRQSTLTRMVDAGLDVARLNFSHGTADEHRRLVAELRKASRLRGRPVAVLADLQGPRFRVGRLPGGRVELETGTEVELVAGVRSAPGGKIPVSYRALCRDVARGDTLLLDDGNLSLTVTRVRAQVVRCVVERGGELSDHKGINIPGKRLSAAALTAKDRRDLRQAVEMGADWLAVSFVRKAADVTTAKRLLKRAGREIPVMAKIERPEAVDDLDAILAASDGLMVARGDLAVEVSPEKVPHLQKEIIERANAVGKPVITATQMLESMRFARRPTRAEASDVANAILDGSSGLLLTAETAVGRYPVETIRMMARIIAETEASGRARRAEDPAGSLSIAETACLAASRAAEEVGARRVVVFTESGFTAREVARFRPRVPIVAFTPYEEVRRRLAPVWGVHARHLAPVRSTDALVRALEQALVEGGLAKRGETVVVLMGLPLGVTGTTNLIKIHQVGSSAGSGGEVKTRKRKAVRKGGGAR